jgi:uncharacterized protein with von Willebrand factor type A (vWA) domain
MTLQKWVMNGIERMRAKLKRIEEILFSSESVVGHIELDKEQFESGGLVNALSTSYVGGVQISKIIGQVRIALFFVFCLFPDNFL